MTRLRTRTGGLSSYKQRGGDTGKKKKNELSGRLNSEEKNEE